MAYLIKFSPDKFKEKLNNKPWFASICLPIEKVINVQSQQWYLA